MDTYCIGKQPLSSTSTIHKITSRKVEFDDFEGETDSVTQIQLSAINIVRISDMSKKEKIRRMKSMLPDAYLQTRVIQINYQSLRNIYHQRKNHILEEWGMFIKVIEELPYFEELIK